MKDFSDYEGGAAFTSRADVGRGFNRYHHALSVAQRDATYQQAAQRVQVLMDDLKVTKSPDPVLLRAIQTAQRERVAIFNTILEGGR